MDQVQNSESGKISVLLAIGIRISGPEQIQAICDTAGLWIFINLGYWWWSKKNVEALGPIT